MSRRYFGSVVGLLLFSANLAHAVDSDNAPRPVPLTRPEMKQFLEDMKARKPRIPLPELTEEDKAKLGERATSYEARLRHHYLPASDGQGRGTGGGAGPGAGFGFFGGFGREPDSDMSLDYAFKTQLFWIVSRTNNCQYCLGHQESKLLGAGMTEDEIAALDGDWSEFKPAQQAAYALARKITYEPHQVDDSDIDAVKKHFTDKQILEMLLSVAGNNAINRWKEGAGIPQSTSGGNFGNRRPGAETSPAEKTAPRDEAAHSYLTPTSARFQNVVTKVAPVVIDPTTGQTSRATVFRRPPLESPAEANRALEAARSRTPRLPLVDEAKAREFVPADFPTGPLPQWVRLLANFPNTAQPRITTVYSTEKRGDLSPLLKAQVSWIIARQDRAWYAAGEAKRRLRELGQTDSQIEKLDGNWAEFTPAERSLFTVARNLSASPVVLTDAEVEEAVRLVGPRDVVQLISYTTGRASFDRITEVAGLRLEN